MPSVKCCLVPVLLRAKHGLHRIPAPPPPALYLSMDHISGTNLLADTGNIQGTLENAPLLVFNAVRGKALQLDGVNQAVNLGNQRHRCLGERLELIPSCKISRGYHQMSLDIGDKPAHCWLCRVWQNFVFHEEVFHIPSQSCHKISLKMQKLLCAYLKNWHLRFNDYVTYPPRGHISVIPREMQCNLIFNFTQSYFRFSDWFQVILGSAYLVGASCSGPG